MLLWGLKEAGSKEKPHHAAHHPHLSLAPYRLLGPPSTWTGRNEGCNRDLGSV